MDFVLDFFSDIYHELLDWVFYYLQYFLGFMMVVLFKVLGYCWWILETILAPFWLFIQSVIDLLGLDTLATKLADIFSGGLGYFSELFLLHYAVGSTLTAYSLRFLIRRIPIIG